MTTEAANSSVNKKAAKSMRTRMVTVTKKAKLEPVTKSDGEPGESKRLPDDQLSALAAAGSVLDQPFDLLTLTMLPENNTELNQCVEAMAVNIEGFGHRYIPRVDPDAEGVPKDLANQVRAERVRLENFFTYANIEDSFIELRKKRRRDLETTGNAYWEVIRSAKGAIQGFEYIPSYQINLGKMDDTAINVEIPILRLNVDGSVDIDRLPTRRKFRTYIQTRQIFSVNGSRVSDYRTVWFKEFGDPRVLDNRTGEVVPAEKVSNWDGKGNPMPEHLKANEMVHFKIFSARSAYGIPRYIGNLLSIFGDRKAEEINYHTFENNCVPSMMLLVSNGQITQGSIDRIQEYVDSQVKGSDNWSKFLIIEAASADETDIGEESGVAKIAVEKMRDQQQDDALFQEYSANNQDKIRRAFRLPPIIVGRSDNYNKATAETSRKLADEQVFAPERTEFDSWINRCLFPAMGIVYHKFKSNSPNTTDNTELVKILSGSEKTGGMTPRIARKLLGDILGDVELPEFPAEFPADVPFSLTMAEAVKNQADATEPGQTVTAIKSATEAVEEAASRIEDYTRQQEESASHPQK